MSDRYDTWKTTEPSDRWDGYEADEPCPCGDAAGPSGLCEDCEIDERRALEGDAEAYGPDETADAWAHAEREARP